MCKKHITIYNNLSKGERIMKKLISMLLVLLMLITTMVTGCGKKDGSSFTIGAWNGNVFENSWLNMKFETDGEWNVYTDEEIAEISGIGQEVLSELKGTSKKELEAAMNLTTVYGFVIDKGIGEASIQLVFENLAKTKEGTKTTEEEYVDIVLDQLENLGYEVIEEITDVKLADKNFKLIKLSFQDLITQDFYVYKQGKYMVSMVVSYTDDYENTVKEFVDNITVLD